MLACCKCYFSAGSFYNLYCTQPRHQNRAPSPGASLSLKDSNFMLRKRGLLYRKTGPKDLVLEKIIQIHCIYNLPALYPWPLDLFQWVEDNVGGLMLRIKGQLNPQKKGCCLISFAPVLDPKRVSGSLCNNPLINCRAARLTGILPGNVRSLCRMLVNVLCLFLPLKGVRPYSISYNKIPRAHQSIALLWPAPVTISGAMYSSVPTNEFDCETGSAINVGGG